MTFSPVLFVFIAAITYVFHSVCVKSAAGKIDILSGIFFWSLGAFIIGCGCFIYSRLTHESINITTAGASFLAIAGAFIAIGTTSFLLAYKNNIDYSFAAPVVNISVVTAGLVIGWLVFKEDISLTRLAGILLGTASIILLTRS